MRGGTHMKDSVRTPYEKPTISYWSAEELNRIEAKMSGGGGGAYTPPTTYTSWYYHNSGGALIINVTTSKSSRLIVYKSDNAGLLTVQLIDKQISGSWSGRVEAGYAFRFKISITYPISANASCTITQSTDYLSSASNGAKWLPNDWGIRPVQSPICRMRWYVSTYYSEILYQTLIAEFYNDFINFLKDELLDQARDALIAALNIPMGVAKTIVSGFVSILTIWQFVDKARMIQLVRERLGTDFLITAYDYGDGGTPHITTEMAAQSWSGPAVYGEPGYSGTFERNEFW